jgi:alginate O-acetyltransferase complex protein AlgI
MPSSPDQLPDLMLAPGAMLFNSFEYLLLFLPLTVVVYFFLSRRVGAMAGKLWLVLASLFFYGWWSVSYLWLICGSMLFNYGMARWLGHADGAKARIILAAAITGNLALLGYYKYADFFISNINLLGDNPMPLLHLALPLGISFFTFTQIAFLVDVHRKVAHEYSLVHYFLFVTYFPHLIAGPILHHKEMMPQFASAAARTVDWRNVQLGLFILAIGLIKKVVLADSLAYAANEGFSSTTPLVFHNAWITSLSYTLQLYFDFSGYCDMAIGASLIFNIRLPENFNSPYKALNIQDFWRRWHITLSRWLRDYLYIPLGGNRYGISRSYAALLVTFLLGGLWHGPSWTFVVWGLLHGAAAVLHRGWTLCHFRMPAFLGWMLTFLFVNTAWVFFRAADIAAATHILKGMAGMNGFPSLSDLAVLASGIVQIDTWKPFNEMLHFPARKLLLLAAGLALVWIAPNTREMCQKKPVSEPGVCSILLVGSAMGFGVFYMLFIASGTPSFIYFYF